MFLLYKITTFSLIDRDGAYDEYDLEEYGF